MTTQEAGGARALAVTSPPACPRCAGPTEGVDGWPGVMGGVPSVQCHDCRMLWPVSYFETDA